MHRLIDRLIVGVWNAFGRKRSAADEAGYWAWRGLWRKAAMGEPVEVMVRAHPVAVGNGGINPLPPRALAELTASGPSASHMFRK
jgi:hypothetical protein